MLRASAIRALTLLLGLGSFLGCSGKRLVVGEQCPSPFADQAAFAATNEPGAMLFGTSCAPCKASEPKFDKRGCPIYVTFESCGGDICLNGALIARTPDAGSGEDGGVEPSDAAADASAADAGINGEEDGGAP